LASLLQYTYVIAMHGKSYNIIALLGGTVGNLYGEVAFACY
jgi:hypothetical protein